ncbi:hypothetical protein OpiT1DRAFT_01220 [Opitutaceae bacterium TAV1]|nr:hypothetical protein OpiT1DRAFT_01220 [Opitutaceae bacterium TAV1]
MTAKRKLSGAETRRGLRLWRLRKQHAEVRRQIGTGAHRENLTWLQGKMQEAKKLEAEIKTLAGETGDAT